MGSFDRSGRIDTSPSSPTAAPPEYAHERAVQAAWLGCTNVGGTPAVGLHPPHPVVASWTQTCRGSCSHSQRGISPSEDPAQDAERHARNTTRTPRSPGAKRTKTTEVTQTQRLFIRTRKMSPKNTLVHPQRQDTGRAQSQAPGATMGGPVPNGPRSQARDSCGPCPASSVTLPLEEDPRPSRADAGRSLGLPRFRGLPRTHASG